MYVCVYIYIYIYVVSRSTDLILHHLTWSVVTAAFSYVFNVILSVYADFSCCCRAAAPIAWEAGIKVTNLPTKRTRRRYSV